MADVTTGIPAPLVELRDDRLTRRGLTLWLMRDDLTDAEIPGNKWRKLKHNLTAAAGLGHRTLLTFGGAYSGHIRATAAAGHRFGFSTIGVIRGEEHLPLNPVLEFAAGRGMRLTYLDRSTYRRKTDPEVLAGLRGEWGDFYLVPEGGSNELAVRGCAELPQEIGPDFDVICCPCGTGGTLAGIAAALRPGRRAIGFSVLKGADFLDGAVRDLQERTFGHAFANWHIEHGFHLGGYARRPPQLDAFVSDFERRHGVALERVYVAKMMYGVLALAERGAFARGTRIVAVITGPAAF